MFKTSPSKSNLSMSNADVSNLDFKFLEDQDPTIQEGFVNIYETELVFKIQLIDQNNDSDDFPNQEQLKIRILVQGENKNLREMRIELSSENDLFFHFIHKIDQELYEKVREEQKLNCKFIDYPAVCVKNFDQCVLNQNQYIPILTIMQDGMGKVEIIQNREYKQVQLLELDFMSSDDDTIKNIITYKNQNMKQKISMMESKMHQEIVDLLKVKNPSLLLQIQKGQTSVYMEKSSYKKR